MEDITPLNLDDKPKLFGLRYDQLISCMGSLILATQLYSWLNPIPIAGGHDLRLDFCIFIGLCGPVYCLVTLNNSASHWETIMNFWGTSQLLMPGPDPNPVRFLVDEELPDFLE
jgi:hypothetical protein